MAEGSLASLGPTHEALARQRVVAHERLFACPGAHLETELGRRTDLELGDNLQCLASGAESSSTSGDQTVLIVRTVALAEFAQFRDRLLDKLNISVQRIQAYIARNTLRAAPRRSRYRTTVVPVVHPGDPAPLIVGQVVPRVDGIEISTPVDPVPLLLGNIG